MRESHIEIKLRKRVESIGGIALKLTGTNGIPDRLVLLPGGRIRFVETKAPGEKPRPLQEYRIRKLRALGFDCRIIDSLEGVELIGEEVNE